MDPIEKDRIFKSFYEPKTIIGVKDRKKVYKVNKVLLTFVLILFPVLFIVIYVVGQEDSSIQDTGYAWFIYTAVILGTISIVYIIAYAFCVIGKYIIRFESGALIIETIGGMEKFSFNKGVTMYLRHEIWGPTRHHYSDLEDHDMYWFYIKQGDREVELPYSMMGEDTFFELIDNLIFEEQL